jgi:hypothetical protein
MIYFVQAASGGAIKIGHSQDVDARVRRLESWHGRPLALLATRPGGRAEEQEWHRRFSHLRLGRTEQFRPAAELLEAIGRPLLVGPNPDAVEPMNATGAELKAVRLELTPEEHRELRIEAAKHGMSMAAFARKAIQELLAAKRKEGRR